VKRLTKRDPDAEGNDHCHPDENSVPWEATSVAPPLDELAGTCLLVHGHGS
jgi:hypothetical protein